MEQPKELLSLLKPDSRNPSHKSAISVSQPEATIRLPMGAKPAQTAEPVNLGDLVAVGEETYKVLGESFSRRRPPQVLGQARFMAQLDQTRGAVIPLHEGETPYTEDRVPRPDEVFATVTQTTAEYVRDASRVLERGGHVLIAGPTGCGKTTLAKTVCRLANRNATELTFSGDTKQKDFMWYDVLTEVTNWETGTKQKTVVRVPGPLLEGMINGDTVIINEPNQMSADLQSLFFQVMDTGEILFSDFEQLKSFYQDKLPRHVPHLPVLQARKGFDIVATYNPDYIGTETINKAWERRFKRHGGFLEMDYLPENEEVEAVVAELEQRNRKFERKVEVNLRMTEVFVTAANRLRSGLVTYEEGNPPQVKTRVNEVLKKRFRDLVSTRSIIYWMENYLLNDINAAGAAEKTFMVTLDRRNRVDAEVKAQAVEIVRRQVDQLIGGDLAFLEGLEKPSVKPRITAPFAGRKVVDIREISVDGRPVQEKEPAKEKSAKSPEELLAESDELTARLVGDAISGFAARARDSGRIRQVEFEQAMTLIRELRLGGLAGSEGKKDELRTLLKVTDEEYDGFLAWAESRYKWVLRRKGLLKDTLPIKDVDVPSVENVLPVVGESTLGNLQMIDAAIARGKFIKLRGPTGAGKSSLARTWAYLHQRRLVEYPFSGETSKSDFAYKTTLVEGETRLLIQFLYKAAEHGYGVLINEFNMAWPEVPMAFMNLVDKGETVRLPDGRVIRKHPDFFLIATENPTDPKFAASAQYAGTKPQNQAVENRFGVNMEVSYPPEDEEQAMLTVLNPGISPKLASDLVTFVNDMRQAIEAPTISEAVKKVLRRFAISTDEMMQMVIRNSTDKDLASELAKTFANLGEEDKRLTAPHLARLMPILGT